MSTEQDEFAPPEQRISLEEQCAAIEREIRMRRRVYPRWVEQGRMQPKKAQAEIDAMLCARAALRELAAKDDLFAPPPPSTVPLYIDGRVVGWIEKASAASIFAPSGPAISFSVGYNVNEGVKEVAVVREPAHPDKPGGSSDRMAELNRAREQGHAAP